MLSPLALWRSSGNKDLGAATDVVIKGDCHARNQIESILVPSAVKQGEQAPQLLADVRPERYTRAVKYIRKEGENDKDGNNVLK